jgi:hypothetical protein
MRAFALLLIAISELLILLLLNVDLSASSLSLISTLVVVVAFAFASSALLRNIRSLTLAKNYMISGVIGVIIGVIYYLWAGENLNSLVVWLKDSGINLMLVIIFIAALILFLNKGKKTTVTT